MLPSGNHSRLIAKINRNFEVFTPTDFLAAITQHIPDKGVQMVCYYGWYSNKMRGVRHRHLPPELLIRRPGVSPPPPAKLPSKRWRDLTCPAVASAKADPPRLARGPAALPRLPKPHASSLSSTGGLKR